MPTATNLGLGGQPVKFLGAYLKSISTNLGLTSSAGTANITLVEDECATPPVLFNPPAIGSFKTVKIGELTFSGVVTQYRKDIANVGGRTISVNMSDVREIMNSIPMILAPGFRQAAAGLEGTGCSILDIFGAFDDFDNTGINLSGWNQAGLKYERIALALNGGNLILPGLPSPFNVTRVSATVFNELYVFDMTEVTAKVNTAHRINSNLISIADFIQDLAQNNSFDWYVEATRINPNKIEVTIKTIDRSIDNVNIDLDNFLTVNKNKVQTASSGIELRNEVACSILYGAPVESLRKSTILGMANDPIDLSEEDGTDAYFMTEEEMRVVLGSLHSWVAWVKQNGDFNRYSISTRVAKPIYTIEDGNDPINQMGAAPLYSDILVNEEERKKQNKIFEKLKGHAEATYGKRFLFNTIIDVDYIDAAWTFDVVSGGVKSNIGGSLTALDAASANVNPNEFFRNPDGKTRCYVEFSSAGIDPESVGTGSVFDINQGFTVGKVKGAPQALEMEKQQWNKNAYSIEADKANYLVDAPGGLQPDRIYVAGTIEKDNNVVRIESPVIFDAPDIFIRQKNLTEKENDDKQKTAENIKFGGNTENKKKREVRLITMIRGAYASFIQNDGAYYQPVAVYVPTRDKFLRYGPVFSSNVGADSQGRVEILQDDGFAPWEFGGSTVMIDAMQFKVDNASSSIKSVQSADITIEGYPKFSIGESLGLNSNISQINVNIADNGVSTQYRLQSFLRKFGELSKRDLATLSIFARRSGARTFPQNSVNFINTHRVRIQEQFSGRGSSVSTSSTGAAKTLE